MSSPSPSAFRLATVRISDDYASALELVHVPSHVHRRVTICIKRVSGPGIIGNRSIPVIYSRRDTWLEILSIYEAPDMRGMLLKSIEGREIEFLHYAAYWANDVDARRSISPI